MKSISCTRASETQNGCILKFRCFQLEKLVALSALACEHQGEQNELNILV